MKIEVPEAEILRTPIKIEKLSLRNRSGGGFIMNFEFHGFLTEKKNVLIFFELQVEAGSKLRRMPEGDRMRSPYRRL